MNFLLTNMVQGDPFIIWGAIARFLGWIISVVFNGVYFFTERNSLGLSIIALTIIVRLAMVPLAAKSQKSMVAMQRLNPEIEKIKKKYGNTKDPEQSKKMNMEMQALYAKHKVNPLSGCLPLLIQMPIFFGLSYLMQQSYRYITKLGDVYSALADKIIGLSSYTNVMKDIILPHVPNNMKPFDLSVTSNMVRALNKLSTADWTNVFGGVPLNHLAATDWSTVTGGLSGITDPATMQGIATVFVQKQNIETFMGLNLLDPSGWKFPGVLIPILTALITLLTSYLSMKMTKNSGNPSQGMSQKVMLFAMPLVMGFFTVNYAAGVGVYWITSSAFQAVQQFFLNKKYSVNAPASPAEIEVKEVKDPPAPKSRRKKY
ncbi:MAG: YidC/Oxa1 family membrane protein insertase [Defluviitaleaceae bacterium]|nr:YidC/Oxa1 family membrane protein insertase [Defluviitaleaceae bacterium]